MTISASAGNTRLLLVVAVGAAILAAAFLVTLSPWSDPPPESADRFADGELSSAVLDESPSENMETLDGEEDTTRIGVAPEVPPAEESAASTEVTVRMRFVDPSNAPLPGVAVKVTRFGHVRPGEKPNFSRGETESGLAGIAELALSVPDNRDQVRLSVNARFPWHISFSESYPVTGDLTMDLGDIVLEPAGAVSGRVTDRAGMPIEKIRVVCTGAESDSLNMEEVRRDGPRFWFGSGGFGRTGKDGTFRLAAARIGSRRLWAGGTDHLYSCSEPIEVVAGVEVRGVEIVLDERPRDQLIECVVLDPGGEPVPRARVRISSRGAGPNPPASSG